MSNIPPPSGHPGRPPTPPPTGAGTPPGPPPPTSGATTGPQPRRNTAVIVVAIVAAVVVLAGAIVAVVALTKDEAEAGEIFLESASSPGTDPFTTGLKGEAASVTTTTASTTATTAGSAPVVATASGGQPGLYGGSKDNGRCDPAQQVDFLKKNPSIAQAFVNALNRDPTLRWAGGTQVTVTQIPDYFKELTPVTLMSDTRVTNYGYRNGSPTPRQAVLQAGTAVLVDRYGVPRVKCNCGNPLTQPNPVKAKPTYTGPAWPGFNPTTVVVVNQTNIEINIYVLVNVDGSGMIERPAGTTGSQDTLGTGSTTTTTPTTAGSSTTTTTSGTTSTSSAGPTGDAAAYCAELKADIDKYRGLDPTLPEIVHVFDRLVDLAPAEIRPAMVTIRDAVAQAAAAGKTSLSVDDSPGLANAVDQWLSYATGTCGIDLMN